jgi:uncharacterized phiE125 gp8 family phage protein
MKLERIVDPIEKPILLETVESALNLPSGTDTDLLNLYIGSATDDLERDTDMSLISQTWRITLDRFPTTYYQNSIRHYDWQTIFVPKGNLISVSKFDYLDTDENIQSLVDGTDYTLTNTGTEARFEPIDNWAGTFADRNEAVDIEVVMGLGIDSTEMPDWVQTALILKVKGLYEDCFEKYEKAYDSAICSRKLDFDSSKNDR